MEANMMAHIQSVNQSKFPWTDEIHGIHGPESSSWLSSSPLVSATSPPERWAAPLLADCGKAVSADDKSQVQQLMWMLNELSSPYGHCDQRLASYFFQALFCKITGTASRCHTILNAAAERSYSFDSMRKMILKFEEVSPWTTFGHVACNGAILEAVEGEMKVHIVDMSSTLCTQWPTLLEALATRPEGAPHLRLTTICLSKEESPMKVMREVRSRMEKSARLKRNQMSVVVRGWKRASNGVAALSTPAL